MTIRIGYACINTQLASPNRTCRLSNATPERVVELGWQNLNTLSDILRWNRQHGVQLFRISSESIPLASHPAVTVRWWEELAPELNRVGELVRASGIRVSMHPGQFTVINSPREDVVIASFAELDYHARFLDSLGLDPQHKLILHLGGVYGDKPAAMARFVDRYLQLPETVRRRLVLENDEKNYNLAEALEVSTQTGAPVVFDVFHHAWNPSLEPASVRQLIETTAATWGAADGRQKIHYSNQWQGKLPGSHSETVDTGAFLDFYQQIMDLDLDVMLEVKDKEQSVMKLFEAIPGLRDTAAI